jgi:CDP-paratose 2-epimerase
MKENTEGEGAPRDVPDIGILEWFRPGEHARVDAVLADLRVLGVERLRTGFSWADWHTPEGQDWFAWLFPRLSGQVEILPCFVYTPPSLGLVPKTSSPPRAPKAYADFLDQMDERFGRHFEWVELWNEPNNRREWDFTLDPDWKTFSAMIGGAAYWMKKRGKRTVLGGTGPMDPNWGRIMCERGVMEHIDVLGVHAFPATYEMHWEGWKANLARMRAVLDRAGAQPRIWVTETGYSTGRNDERRQLESFLEALEAPAERVYWYAARDLDPDLPTVDGFHSDEKDYHFGLRRADGSPKLLHRLWSGGGLGSVRASAWMARSGAGLPGPRASRRTALITGGAGFIGTNVAHRLASAGLRVIVYDNLARDGVETNLRWLRATHGDAIQTEVADVLDAHSLARADAEADQVFHFAAQVAVTTSLCDPLGDFSANGRGTLNLLEALRKRKRPPPLLFTSTNKVYGGMPDVPVGLRNGRWEPRDEALAARGFGEERPLDFHSPYGCSKGCADQYVLDYARTFGLPAVVFRMSCIYGPHQWGNEDQGWLAHFLLRAMRGETLCIYGDGRQVRDVLYVEDLVDAMMAAQGRMPAVAGKAFNMGGGPANTLSLLELLELIRALHGSVPPLEFRPWRTGDQRYYVSDTERFQAATEWLPQVAAAEGVERLYHWLRARLGYPLPGPQSAGSPAVLAGKGEV